MIDTCDAGSAGRIRRERHVLGFWFGAMLLLYDFRCGVLAKMMELLIAGIAGSLHFFVLHARTC